MVGNLFRVVQFIISVALVAGSVIAIVWIVSNAIQVVGNLLGYEIGSLFGWIKDKISRLAQRK
jgi:hypothetical protein